jgi:tetratricopeptide (TPR) repeat protein
LERATEIARGIGNLTAAGEVQTKCGQLCFVSGQYNDAVKHFLTAESFYKKAKQTPALRLVYRQLSATYEQLGNKTKAKKYARKA